MARHTDWVRDVAWAPNKIGEESLLASCSEDGSVIIWRKKSNEKMWNSTLLPRFDNPVWRLIWTVTGNVLAISSGEGDVTLWKQKLDGSWKKMSTVEGEADSSAKPPGPPGPPMVQGR